MARMIVRPRRAMLVGLIFIGLGVSYGLVSHEWIGVTLLLALGLAMGMLAFVLMTASPRGDETD
jgi:hypothetical protein